MQKFNNIFKSKCNIIAMIHSPALPGSPNYNGNFNHAIEQVRHEAHIYKSCSVDAVLLENMHDVPYIQSNKMTPEIVSCMTRLAVEIKNIIPKQMPLGIQVLACGNQQALAIAKATECQFVRAEGFVFSHIGDEGFIDANAGTLLRYRKQIDANNVLIFTDLKKKHSSHAITQDVSLLETAHAAKFFLTDGIILTGTSTGNPVNIDDVNALYGKVKDTPLLMGSGITLDNIKEFFHKSDAAIIGSHFKKDGDWQNELCTLRVNRFMNKIVELRQTNK